MRFEEDEAGINRIEKSSGVRKHSVVVAREILSTATAIGTATSFRTGHYVRGLAVKRRFRSVYVAATDFKSHWIEWGAGPSPYRGHRPFFARHVLERASRVHCDKFIPAPKGTR